MVAMQTHLEGMISSALLFLTTVFLLQADSDLLKKANTVSKEISEELLSIILFSQV